MAKNFVSSTNMTVLMTAIAAKFDELSSVFVPKGTTAFAGLPATLTKANLGWFYNISNDFTTDARFVEGAGKKYPAGTNVYVVDNSTVSYTEVTPEGTENPSEEGWYEESAGAYVLSEDITVQSGKTYYEQVITALYQFDILGGDISEIYNQLSAIADMITGEFDATESYTEGDVVIYNNKLYKCTTVHEAGEWDAEDFTETTVVELIQTADVAELTTQQITDLINILNE